MARARAWLAEELRRLLPPFLFFLVAFNLLALTAQLSGARAGLLTYATASLSALVCGKAVLLADKLPFFNQFPHHPLIWNVVWKALLYTLVSTAIRLAEHGFEDWRADPHIGAGAEEMIAQFSWAHFTMIQAWLAMLFLVYTAFSELGEALGPGRLRRLFLGPVEGAR